MAKQGTEVIVAKLPVCDICTQRAAADPDAEVFFAYVDGKTSFGPWANMCAQHFEEYGIGLGTGMGQRLILANSEQGIAAAQSASDRRARARAEAAASKRRELYDAIDSGADLDELEDIVGDGDIAEWL